MLSAWTNRQRISSLAEKIKECQEECKHTYGYRRVHIWLDRNGVHCNPKTVLRVMNKYSFGDTALQISQRSAGSRRA